MTKSWGARAPGAPPVYVIERCPLFGVSFIRGSTVVVKKTCCTTRTQVLALELTNNSKGFLGVHLREACL